MIYNLSSPLDKANFLLRAKKLAESGVIVDLTEKKPRRSLPQNKYLHIILAYFGAQTGNTLEWVKQQYYKKLVNPDLFIREKEDKYLGRIKVLRSSADLDTSEFSLSIERFRNWAAQEVGIYIPSADEAILIPQMEIEIERSKEFL
ncbi:hypothetical protein J5A68_02665 [Prevotella melaninogenica]|uniref:hypothetical protein n=1 Tax=Prevotella melaninogenica TaxID=28132 RepID=UPI001BA81F7A|nr:hypothetical protein [Prevotella melaninogenica]QUB68627.1 hypothetical protein J5A68_02665 [Prevotella melaninogenica]